MGVLEPRKAAVTTLRFLWLSTVAGMMAAWLCAARPAGAAPLGAQLWGLYWWRLEPHAYFDPLHSDPRSANVRVCFPAWSDAFPFSQSSGRRLVWDLTMGREIPLFGFSNALATTVPPPGSWGFGLWLPIGFHMIEDLKDPSGPILNVDYRFGGMGKFHYAFSAEHHLGV